MLESNNHNEMDREYRDEIKRKIFIILKRKMKEMNHDIKEQQLTQLSAAFEARLYKSAPTLEFHRDCSTLERRVKILALQLGQRLEKRKRSQTITKLSNMDRAAIFKSSRRNTEASFEDIQEIVQKVKKLRKNGYIDMRMRENGDTTCHGLSCLVPTTSNPQRTRCTKTSKCISVALKNIYFRTRIVEAFDKIHRLQTKDGILLVEKPSLDQSGASCTFQDAPRCSKVVKSVKVAFAIL
ncbi:predicted protein [Chaetoceros tenuissimus]|uniref:Uncharacterized protein n=1 Tax=Chaetoceros tenuissimus TaxID=426638 RepID=A0AAD3HAS4_9STRA|nr:predicted protein [Chaetoceros tenuissimus]